VNNKSEYSGSLGIAKTPLVFHEGKAPMAVVTHIVARRRKTAVKTRIRFQGPAVFTKNASTHIRKIVWPVADTVLSRLIDQSYGFDLSVSNLSAASSREVAVDISGFSADVAVFVAILSAGTSIPVVQNLVFTGHIAGTDGSIRMVNGIPEKAKAVIKAPDTDTLVYPDLGCDLSMVVLSSQETERIEGALAQAKDRIDLAAVGDVGDLVKIAFPERDILSASLKENFFHLRKHPFGSGNPIDVAVQHITSDLDRRLWKQLYADFSQGQIQEAISILIDFADYLIRNESYLPEAGQNLFQVVASLPPDTRRLKLRFPLLPVHKCAELCRFARNSDNNDAWLFLKACSGEIAQLTVNPSPTNPKSIAEKSETNQSLDTIISEIEADRMASEVTVKINNAQATFILNSVIIDSHDHFCETIASYYIHLSKHLHGFTYHAKMDAALSEGFEILEKAFAKEGGFPAALAEARNATKGGMRYVLDIFTDQYLREEKEKYVSRIFKLAMDPLDWDRKVRLMASVIDRLKTILPSEITDQPAKRFAAHYEPIVRALIQSRDQLASVFRTF
jgi:hypothetical protein